MAVDSQQLELIPTKGVSLSVGTELEIARSCRSRHHALVRCYEASGLAPKQLQAALRTSQGTLSKVLNGQAFPSPDSYFLWMAACGNLIPFRYDAHSLNHTIAPIPTTLEAENERLKSDNAEKDRVIKYLGEMLRGAR